MIRLTPLHAYEAQLRYTTYKSERRATRCVKTTRDNGTRAERTRAPGDERRGFMRYDTVSLVWHSVRSNHSIAPTQRTGDDRVASSCVATQRFKSKRPEGTSMAVTQGHIKMDIKKWQKKFKKFMKSMDE